MPAGGGVAPMAAQQARAGTPRSGSPRGPSLSPWGERAKGDSGGIIFGPAARARHRLAPAGDARQPLGFGQARLETPVDLPLRGDLGWSANLPTASRIQFCQPAYQSDPTVPLKR